MVQKKWKHKITAGFVGVILSFILLVIFSGVTFFFRSDQSSANLLGKIVVLFAAVAFVLALYRAIFFKVLIDKDGFFFQTAPCNGRYYHFYEITRIWTSTGRETNSNEASYCHFEVNDGRIFRFFYTGADIKAVNYLLKQVNIAGKADRKPIQDDAREHIISGKVQGLQRIAVMVFISVILFILTSSLIKEGFPPVTYVLPVVFAVAAIAIEIIQHFFYKILIQKDGFYCQTNPFNGEYFAYSGILNCQLVEKRKKFGSVFRKGTRRTQYFYFLIFTDAAGKTHRILYNKALFQREMDVLVSRIKAAQSKADNNWSQ